MVSCVLDFITGEGILKAYTLRFRTYIGNLRGLTKLLKNWLHNLDSYEGIFEICNALLGGYVHLLK